MDWSLLSESSSPSGSSQGSCSAYSYGRAAGWGFQLQEPIFVGGLAAILFIFGLNLFGLFRIWHVIFRLGRTTGQQHGKGAHGITGGVLWRSPCHRRGNALHRPFSRVCGRPRGDTAHLGSAIDLHVHWSRDEFALPAADIVSSADALAAAAGGVDGPL